MYDFTHGEFGENITRVENLIEAYNELEANKIGDIQLRKDVLRASIVFMHSSLEEVVRNLFLLRLPNGNTKNLNKIPFAGHETTHRPKEILLGNLKAFSGMLVDNIILRSINEYVDTMSINGSNQLAECLEIADVQIVPLRKYFTSLDSLMKRRHQIVHQMDRANSLDPLLDPITNIDIECVEQWKNDLCGFYRDLMIIIENIDTSSDNAQHEYPLQDKRRI
ncbi:HEPN domain-containing protein [Shewanella sp. NKUCC06_TVS]|uniref:HEPN domain-containing protein n=1 Tax=Shewanella sp. NKUCC06_TVS TaxID=2842128 RepID=UPI001C5AB21B|nr:hypothetical protein [Shewanella sp. NKUCC06_TVS]